MIPEDKIQDIREATDIIEVVSQYVTMKKRGRSWIGLCPFHNEKTPSFNVDPEKGFYKCFGCGAGGNVFTFLMQMDKMSFPEVVRSLASKAGIALPEFQQDEGKLKETELLYHANEYAAGFFQRCLYETEPGKKVLEYFLNRGFSREITEKFQVGYAPDYWDGLVKSANKAGVKPDILLKAGLTIERKEGRGMYDRFRCRLMFPVHNSSGKVVGFGGRILKKGEKTAKYLNSPETPVYHKSKLLYGLHQAKMGIRDQDRVVLVEGYTDVIRCHQEGAGFAVATSGTALTADQAKLISRYTKKVYLVYDGDSAGFKAALRGSDILVGAGLNVSVAPLPGSSDPDTFLKGKGAGAMQALLDNSCSFIDFRLDRLKAENKLTSPAERAQAANVLMETIRRIQDPIEKSIMTRELAEKLRVEENVLKQRKSSPTRILSEKESLPQKKKIDRALVRAEKVIIKLLMESTAGWGPVIFTLLVPDMFQIDNLKQLFIDFQTAFQKKPVQKSGAILDRYGGDPLMARLIADLLADPLEEEVDRSKLGLDCVIQIKRALILEKIRIVRDEIQRIQAEHGNHSKQQKDYIKLKNQLTELPEKTAIEWRQFVKDD